MKISKSARILTLGIALPFAVMASSAAFAKDDDKKEHSAGKGMVKGAAAGALLPGVSAGTGAVIGGVSGAAKANKDRKEEKKKE
jgi:hypothetical protein